MPADQMNDRKDRFVLLLLLLLLTGVVVLAGRSVSSSGLARAPVERATPPAEGDAVKAEEDALRALNQAFRDAYRRARQESLDRAGPVLIERGGTLVLLNEGRRQEVEYMPALYHQVKAVAHVPLALYVVLTHHTGGPLGDEMLAELRRLRDLVVKARDGLEALAHPADVLGKEHQVIADALAFLDGVVGRRQVSREELLEFTRAQGPALLALAAVAARSQLDALHAQVSAWRRQLGDEAWARLRVVVSGSAMPRPGHISVQYFAKLLGEAGEGRRLIYAEGLFEEPKALNLLGTHLLDGTVGDAFFADDRRMNRDLLSDAARDYLETLGVEK